MKRLLILSLLVMNLTNCQEKKEGLNKTENKTKMNEEPIYTLKISAANPYEVYVNDMPIEKDHESGSSNTETPFNDFILKSGIQHFKILIFPNKGKTIVDRPGIDHIDVKIYKYAKGLSNMSPDNATVIRQIDLKDLKESPVVEKQFAVDLKVPYEIKGWSGSVDLSKEDKVKLKAEVLAKYNEIRLLINSGDISEFTSQYKVRDREVNESFLNNSDAIKEDAEWMKTRVVNSKGHMNTISNEVLRFYGNGKIVSLENEKHESPLISDDGKYQEVYNILLHRPKPGAPLQILR